jgi:hypothetical protein
MGQFFKCFTAAVTLAAISITPARAACWSDQSVDAARVRDMETMLMVSALRCRISGSDLLGAYNSFVRGSRAALTEVNQILQAQFASNGGLNAYDRYVTSVANHYGAGADGLSCRDMASILSAAGAEGNSIKGLTRLARDAGVEPALPGGRCPNAIAAIR